MKSCRQLQSITFIQTASTESHVKNILQLNHTGMLTTYCAVIWQFYATLCGIFVINDDFSFWPKISFRSWLSFMYFNMSANLTVATPLLIWKSLQWVQEICLLSFLAQCHSTMCLHDVTGFHWAQTMLCQILFHFWHLGQLLLWLACYKYLRLMEGECTGNLKSRWRAHKIRLHLLTSSDCTLLLALLSVVFRCLEQNSVIFFFYAPLAFSALLFPANFCTSGICELLL